MSARVGWIGKLCLKGSVTTSTISTKQVRKLADELPSSHWRRIVLSKEHTIKDDLNTTVDAALTWTHVPTGQRLVIVIKEDGVETGGPNGWRVVKVIEAAEGFIKTIEWAHPESADVVMWTRLDVPAQLGVSDVPLGLPAMAPALDVSDEAAKPLAMPAAKPASSIQVTINHA